MTEFSRRRNAARYALLEKIAELTPRQTKPADVLRLAEAYAWTHEPDNAHGGPQVIAGADGDGDGDGGGGDGGDGDGG